MTSLLRSHVFTHYAKFTYTDGRREYIPVVYDGYQAHVRGRKVFGTAREAEAWAVRFDRKLKGLRHDPV